MSRKKILIIDDEVDFCLLLKSFFIHKDVEIHVAYTLASGLRAIEKHRPDILFLDNNLPDGLGWNMMTAILNQYPEMEVNLISAYDTKELSPSFNNHIKFWEKPINLDELNQYVN